MTGGNKEEPTDRRVGAYINGCKDGQEDKADTKKPAVSFSAPNSFLKRLRKRSKRANLASDQDHLFAVGGKVF
jgi:hypothetical protein